MRDKAADKEWRALSTSDAKLNYLYKWCERMETGLQKMEVALKALHADSKADKTLDAGSF